MEPAATLARRPTLTAPARDSVCDLWVGTKKRAPDRTKKLTRKKDKPLRTGLTKKAPYKLPKLLRCEIFSPVPISAASGCSIQLPQARHVSKPSSPRAGAPITHPA